MSGDPHTDAHRLTVGQVRAFFDRVAEGVAKIEFAALPGFLFVPIDDLGFDHDGPMDQGFHKGGFQALDQRDIVFNGLEIVAIVDGRVFDDFSQSVGNLARGQCLQQTQVTNHKPGLVENPDHVLVSVEIDAVLPADAGIDLRQQTGGHETVGQPPHVGGSRKTGHVADQTTADGEDEIKAVRLAPNQFAVDMGYALQSFDLLTRTNRDHIRRRKSMPVQAVHINIGHDNRTLGRRQIAPQILQVLTDHDIRRACLALNAQRVQTLFPPAIGLIVPSGLRLAPRRSSAVALVIENIENLADLLTEGFELRRQKRLGTITQGLVRLVMDFNHQAMGSDRRRCPRQGNHLVTPPGRMAGIDDDGQMTFLLDIGHGR